MESVRIEILNPSAKKLLKNLADLKLIRISSTTERKNDLKKLLNRLRIKSGFVPSMEEITQEVNAVRSARYEKEK